MELVTKQIQGIDDYSEIIFISPYSNQRKIKIHL